MLEKLKRRFFRPEDSLPDNSLPENSMPEDSPGESLRDDSGFRRFPSHRLRRGRDRNYDRMQVAIREIRQLVQSRLTSRQRQLAVVAMALALVGGVSLAANAAVTDSGPGPQSARDSAAVDREEAADRADRSQREDVAEIEGGERRAAEPKDSPKPKPTETEESSSEDSSSQEESSDEAEPAAKEESEPEPAPDWSHPMPGASTTSCYGMRGGVMHAGVDLASPPGTPIRSVGAGTVTNAGWVFGGYGISVVVDHGNGFLTHYAHASEATVSVGERVSPGEMIAREGSTGDSSGPHLHFEVHSGMWNQVEPTSWLRDRGVNVGGC